MFPPAIHRFTAWLCLVVALWAGALPARALVLCVEPDGCVNVEPATDDHCGGCADACGEHAAEPAGADATDAIMTAAGGCPCIDVVLPASEQDRIRPRLAPVELPALVVAPVLVALVPTAPRPRAAPARRPERPPGELVLARSVVLLV